MMKPPVHHWMKKLDRSTLFKGGIIGVILLYVVTQYPYFYPFPETTGWAVAHLLNAVGILSFPYQNYLILDQFPLVEISGECSGVVLMAIFPIIIFLIPRVKLAHRLGSLLFVPILYMGNIFRIFLDVLIGLRFGPDSLIFFHDTIGQILIFFWAIMLYIVWLKIFDNFPREERILHPDGYD